MGHVSDTEIWHNPRCSKSRATLQLLEGQGHAPKVRLYLESPPSAAELDRTLKMLGLEPRELLRTSEEPYKTLGLADRAKTRSELIEAMAANPILIERPVVIHDGRAALGRPPEKVLELFEED